MREGENNIKDNNVQESVAMESLEKEGGERKEKEPQESVFQREMKELGEERKAFGESVKTLSSLWALARQEKQAAIGGNGEEGEEELSAAQAKERMDATLSKTENAFLMAKQLVGGVVGMKLNEIQRIDIRSASEAGRIAALLKDIEDGYHLAQENLLEVKSLEQKSAEFHEQYKKASLSEAGFGSFDELRDAHYELDRESILLQYDIGRRKNGYFGLGRLIGKEKIKDLEQKIEDLKPKISELGALRELGEEREKSFYDHPIEAKIQSGVKETCHVTLDKILTRHKELVNGISFEEPTALLAPALKERIMKDIAVDDAAYPYVMNIIQNSEAMAKKKAVIDSWWDIYEDSCDLPRENNVEWINREDRIKIQMSKDVFRVYEAVKHNQEVIDIVGGDKLKSADEFLAKSTLEDLMDAMQRNQPHMIELGERLFHFKEPSVIPFAIANAYRQGPYADYSFLLERNGEDTTLSQFVNSFDQEDIKKVQSLNIPGAARTIELVKSNSNFNEKKVKNEESGEEIDNPVYREIQQELGNLSDYYLKNGDNASKMFILDLVRRLEIVPEEVYAREAKIMSEPYEPYDAGPHRELLSSLFSRARDFGDKKSMDIILENYDAADGNTKEAIQKENPQIISFLLKGEHPDPAAIEKTSNIVGIEKGELEETLQFLGELKKAHRYSAVREENDIFAYRDLYKKSEQLSAGKEEKENLSIKRIKEAEEFASKYGYGVENAEILLKITEIPDDTRFLIKKLNEDFKYRLYLPKRGELKRDYSIFDKLLADKKLVEETAKGEQGEYEAKILQEVGTSFLYEGNAAHNELEKIKKDGWITMQTYNRLYAARRAFTGFESYAYSPREGEKHPVINVSFYGNMFSNKGESLLKGGGAKDKNGFLQNGSISGKEAIKVYAPNFELYQKKLKGYQALDSEEARKAFLENFKWSENQPAFSDDPEYKKIEDMSLPIGAAPNGHTRFYATPYGIVSGCVSQEGIFEAESQNLGVSLVTGHKEMLNDFIERQEVHKKLTEEIKKFNAGGFEIEFENTNIPQELKEAVLPANISVGEFLLNLHFEQYLHSGLKPSQDFLKDLMQKFDDGELAVMAGSTPLKLNDKIPHHSKLRVVGQEQEEETLAKAA